MLDLTVLCSVVDNYGDIGFVFRLCRRISEIACDVKLRLVVDNLESFAFMNSGIDPSKAEQEFNGWTILDWKNEEVCRNSFLSRQPEYILQCFQCLRPEWLDDILFSDSFTGTAHIIDVEYLTAEDWADDFHLKKSGTRSASVKKTIFMPGFTKKTGGLVLDMDFMKSAGDRSHALARAGEKLDLNQKEILEDPDWFKILLFSYPRNFDFLVEAIDSFAGFCDRKVHVFLARGISAEPFEKSCQGRNLEFTWSRLPALEQQQWDAFICSMDFNFIRGEDSFSRGALSGVPFVWHAYVQDDEFQLVKVNAFVERLRPFMDSQLFEDYRRFSFLYNRAFDVEPGDEACQVLAPLKAFPSVEESAFDEMRDLAIKLLSGVRQSGVAFKNSACHFIDNGDLAEHLLVFLRTCNLK